MLDARHHAVDELHFGSRDGLPAAGTKSTNTRSCSTRNPSRRGSIGSARHPLACLGCMSTPAAGSSASSCVTQVSTCGSGIRSLQGLVELGCRPQDVGRAPALRTRRPLGTANPACSKACKAGDRPGSNGSEPTASVTAPSCPRWRSLSPRLLVSPSVRASWRACGFRSLRRCRRVSDPARPICCPRGDGVGERPACRHRGSMIGWLLRLPRVVNRPSYCRSESWLHGITAGPARLSDFCRAV